MVPQTPFCLSLKTPVSVSRPRFSPRNRHSLPSPGWFLVGPERRCDKDETRPDPYPLKATSSGTHGHSKELKTLTGFPGGPGGPDGPSGPGSPWKQEEPKLQHHPAGT